MDGTGDFIAWFPEPLSGIILRAMYGTVFDIRRLSTLPEIDFRCVKPDLPPQPRPKSSDLSSLLGSWLPAMGMTGEQVDDLRESINFFLELHADGIGKWPALIGLFHPRNTNSPTLIRHSALPLLP